jgi:hypothetical protein
VPLSSTPGWRRSNGPSWETTRSFVDITQPVPTVSGSFAEEAVGLDRFLRRTHQTALLWRREAGSRQQEPKLRTLMRHAASPGPVPTLPGRVLLRPSWRSLVASPCCPNRLAPSGPRAFSGAIALSAIAFGTDRHLFAAAGAEEQAKHHGPGCTTKRS